MFALIAAAAIIATIAATIITTTACLVSTLPKSSKPADADTAAHDVNVAFAALMDVEREERACNPFSPDAAVIAARKARAHEQFAAARFRAATLAN